MKRKVISVVLSVLMLFMLCSCDGKPATTTAIVGSDADIDEEVYTGNESAWCSALFASPATSYNNGLALVAAEMSNAAENDSGDQETIEKLFSSYGLYACEYYNFDGTGFLSAGGAFAIGQDVLTVNGVDTTILVIVARGTKNLQETIGDLFKGGEIGFLNTKVWNNVYDFEEKVWNGLNDYIEKYPAVQSVEHLKILITGHSLGGAAANMFGARLTHGIGGDEWWGDKVLKDDIYVYTFGAIKVLTTESNASDGYENIHNVYNHYDSFGPNGNMSTFNASSINAKFGHTEEYLNYHPEENANAGGGGWSTYNHNMSSYIEDLAAELITNYPCGSCGGTNSCVRVGGDIEIDSFPAEMPDRLDEFSIMGTWKNTGTIGFGQAQPGSIIAFDGTHCNYYSPYDTYVFYQDNGKWKLDCASFLFSQTLSFSVEIIDADTINIFFGSNATKLERISRDAEIVEAPQESGDDFAIEGSWFSFGTAGFGQAQPGCMVTFDGTHCNFFSPFDTYAFYQEDGQWKLECTSFLSLETLAFAVEVIDSDTINIYYGSTCTELQRIN